MAWFVDLKILESGFYITFFRLFAFGARYKPESFMITAGIYRLCAYFTIVIEE